MIRELLIKNLCAALCRLINFNTSNGEVTISFNADGFQWANSNDSIETYAAEDFTLIDFHPCESTNDIPIIELVDYKDKLLVYKQALKALRTLESYIINS